MDMLLGGSKTIAINPSTKEDETEHINAGIFKKGKAGSTASPTNQQKCDWCIVLLLCFSDAHVEYLKSNNLGFKSEGALINGYPKFILLEQ